MAGIIGIEYYLPEKKLTNEELTSVFHTWSAEKIFKKTGISSRHISGNTETAVDLAVCACEKLFETYHVNRNNIDFIILVTQTPDYVLPTSACILQQILKLRKNIGAYDVNLGCSGFVYGLATAAGLVDSGIASNVLLVTSDTYSKRINKLDRSTRTIFGDGAAATLVGTIGMKIGHFDFGTDGEGTDAFIVPAGGARIPCSEETAIEKENDGNIRSAEQIYMDGTAIFDFTLREVPSSVERVLNMESIKKEDIDLFVFHQANNFMLSFLQKRMKLDKDRFYIDMEDIGNTVSSSIPIALKRAIDKKILKPNQTVLLCGFGVGLSWSSTIIRTGNGI